MVQDVYTTELYPGMFQYGGQIYTAKYRDSLPVDVRHLTLH